MAGHIATRADMATRGPGEINYSDEFSSKKMSDMLQQMSPESLRDGYEVISQRWAKGLLLDGMG